MRQVNASFGKIRFDKNGQFKIQQMSFMLVAVFMFFTLIIMVFVVIQYRNIGKTASLLSKNRAEIMASFLSGMSEFSCGSYCVDLDRVMVLKNKTSYKEFFPSDISYIKFAKIGKEERECNKANYPNCSYIKISYKKSDKTSGEGSFVGLCWHERINENSEKICELGKIIIGYKIKS